MYQFICAFFLFFGIPVLLMKWAAKESLKDLGLGLGDWKAGFFLVAPIGLILIALPGGLSASSMPDFLATYPMAKAAAGSGSRFLVYELAYGFLYYVSYEAFFRGMLQHGLRKELGDLPAILIQTAMTTLLHIGKPQGEIWAALAAGLLFGTLVFRIRSVWPIVVIHFGLGVATDFFCARAAGIW
jgi:uncharacterized protein